MTFAIFYLSPKLKHEVIRLLFFVQQLLSFNITDDRMIGHKRYCTICLAKPTPFSSFCLDVENGLFTGNIYGRNYGRLNR